MRDSGYVLMHRQVFDNPVFKNHFEAMAFLHLVAKAAYAPCCVRYRGRKLDLQRGEVAISLRDFGAAMERDRNWAQRFITRLIEAKMVAKKRDSTETVGDTPSETAGETASNVLSICNYNKYQALSLKAETAIETPVETPSEQPAIHRTNKENERKKERTPYSPPSGRAPSGRASAWNGGDRLPAEWLEWARKDRGWTTRQALDEGQRFIDSAMAKRRTYVDWFAAWRQWCRSPFQKTVATQQERLTL